MTGIEHNLIPMSALLWLNGNSKDTLLQSLAVFLKHIPTSCLQEPLVAGTAHAPVVEAEASAILRWMQEVVKLQSRRRSCLVEIVSMFLHCGKVTLLHCRSPLLQYRARGRNSSNSIRRWIAFLLAHQPTRSVRSAQGSTIIILCLTKRPLESMVVCAVNPLATTPLFIASLLRGTFLFGRFCKMTNCFICPISLPYALRHILESPD